MRRLLTLMLMLSGLALPVHAQDCPARIRIAFPDQRAEPLMMGVGDTFAQPPGLLVDWTRAVLRKLGCLERAEFQRLPNARIRALARPENGRLDLLPGIPEGSPYLPYLRVPDEPAGGEDDLSTGTVEYALYARPADAGAWDGKRLSLRPGQSVGVSRDTLAQLLAEERGWPLELSAGYESAYQKFLAGRSSYLFSYAPFMESRLPSRSDVVKLQPPVAQKRYYVAATRDFYQREARFVRRFWAEMCLQGNALRARPFRCALPTSH